MKVWCVFSVNEWDGNINKHLLKIFDNLESAKRYCNRPDLINGMVRNSSIEEFTISN